MKRNHWRPRFYYHVAFRLEHNINGCYSTESMFFYAVSESAARQQAYRYLKSYYGRGYKILSVN